MGTPQVCRSQRSTGRPPAEVVKPTAGNTFLQSSFMLFASFPFPSSVTEFPPHKPGCCWRETGFSSCNPHNWHSPEATHHFGFLTSSVGEFNFLPPRGRGHHFPPPLSERSPLKVKSESVSHSVVSNSLRPHEP